MRDVLYLDLEAALLERRRQGCVVMLHERSALGPADRMETWRVGPAVWLVFVHSVEGRDRAYAYEHLDDPVGVVARLAPGGGGMPGEAVGVVAAENNRA